MKEIKAKEMDNTNDVPKSLMFSKDGSMMFVLLMQLKQEMF